MPLPPACVVADVVFVMELLAEELKYIPCWKLLMLQFFTVVLNWLE